VMPSLRGPSAAPSSSEFYFRWNHRKVSDGGG
jgi:hypothetical protein